MEDLSNSTAFPMIWFSRDNAKRANEEWGLNCGPAAIAAILGLSLEALRPHLGDFEKKHYTNPTLMYAILRELGVGFTVHNMHRREGFEESPPWPRYGLARVQWEG